jgi:hypothetical protein
MNAMTQELVLVTRHTGACQRIAGVRVEGWQG